MKELYTIGNGFDIHHGLQTHYQVFSYYLQKHHFSIHERLVENYGLPSLDPDLEEFENKPAHYYLWSDFEKRLADFDFQSVLNDNDDLTANPASEEFRDGDWDTFEIVMEEVVNELTTELYDAFKKFINQVDFPENIYEKKISLNQDAFYLNFNYTNSLEHYYNIPGDKILHIHNRADSSNEVLVLGHGIEPNKFKRDEPQPSINATEEELFEWNMEQGRNWELSSDRALDMILTYFSKSHKQTDNVIQQNRPFFDMLDDTIKITVLGHSLGEVDQPYLREILEKNGFKADWRVSYYEPKDAQKIFATLVKLGLPKEKISTFKTTDLLLNK
ncbi:bacteriophage abortive infection AbiH family protein [Pedobacter hiemivivus]|uniref:Bacteriophage abortive infection AbiH n=1 Tax=Pedobacter hiemivivus TaxID=2530454 RepID=A0A4R0NF99_9SPHI|nr:bacteriophage abortive infection AbiH family protein [Pedobacter hiemivivus]TCC99159.1 hypothetical protein EZ444_00295 [Pedobacter hiemivivus]